MRKQGCQALAILTCLYLLPLWIVSNLFREAGGTVFWETSADGQTWVQQGSTGTSNVPFVNAIRPTFYAETWASGSPTPGEGRYASLNVPPSSGTPPVASLSDTFGGSSIDTTKWTPSATAGTVAEGGGTLNMTPNTGTSSTRLYLTSVSQYSLVNSQAKVKLSSVPQGSINTQFALHKDWSPGERLGFWVEQGILYCFYLVAGAEQDVAAPTYSPTNHVWLRIRHDGTTIFWETSADGTNWVIQGQIAASAISYAGNPMNVMFSVSSWSSGASSSTPAKYSNLN